MKKIVYIIIAAMAVFSKSSSGYAEEETSLPCIERSDVAAESKYVDGMEAFLLHKSQCIQDANPWSEESKMKTLPVYLNPMQDDENGQEHPYDSHYQDNQYNQDSRDNQVEKVSESYEDQLKKQLLDKTKEVEIQITVNENRDTVIFFMPCLRIDIENINIESMENIDDTDTTHDQLTLIAMQLQEQFPMICGADIYQYEIKGGDYDAEGKQRWNIAFFLKGQSKEEQIVNYNFQRVEVALDEENKVYSITIHNEDLSNKLGEYPIITAKEAQQRLLKQQYWTTAAYPPEKDKIAKVELVYKTSKYHKYFAPYYRFFISNGETLQNDLMLYSTFYVPAIEEEYLK